MKTIYKCLLIILIISLSSAGCRRNPKLTAEYIDSLKTTFKTLTTDADLSWKTMITEDDQKIEYMKNLLEAASNTGKYDTVTGNNLARRVNTIRFARYDQKSIANYDRIAYYDSLVIQLTDDLLEYIHTRPEIEKKDKFKDLESSLSGMDYNLILQKVDYDTKITALNDFIKENRKILNKVDPEGNYMKMPIFESSPPVK